MESPAGLASQPLCVLRVVWSDAHNLSLSRVRYPCDTGTANNTTSTVTAILYLLQITHLPLYIYLYIYILSISNAFMPCGYFKKKERKKRDTNWVATVNSFIYILFQLLTFSKKKMKNLKKKRSFIYIWNCQCQIV